MSWELIQSKKERECTLDDSGVYTLIDAKGLGVRCDILTDEDVPLVSFVGFSDAVRKDVIHWLADKRHNSPQGYRISAEHASYIGHELARRQAEHW